MDQPRDLGRGRKGQAALFMTMTITVSMGLIGLVTDVGWAYWRREACATAANSAAFAAVSAASAATNQSCGSGTTYWDCSAYSCPASPTLPVANNLGNGCMYAKQNGFLNTGRQSVTMQGGTGTPPTPGISPAYWASATVTERIPTLFSAALGQQWSQVSIQSVAAIFKGGGGGCVYVLNATASGAWTQSGGTFSTGCGIYIDSTSGSALTMSGGVDTLTGGADIYIGGGKSSSGGVIAFTGGGSLNTNQTSMPGNPVSGLTAPTPAGSCTANPNYSGGVGQSNITIPSGTYCSMSISGGTGLVLSGTYIMDGSFSVSGGNITTAAGGATIYFPPSSTGNISVSGGNMTLTAPTSGSLAGFALWKDGTTANSASISGSNLTIDGIIYMPYTALSYSGGNTPVQQSIIVNTIAMSGGNISQPVTSSYFSNGASISGNYIVQ
jgi:hypothetical protein